ncbi:hypothetical protein TRICI_002520 [Trichomonascus ciferrii]|uniref:Uncharacterized protein n=1 Tax=Trichomonascus ciferrii TaxID=44093 RepID=A0A642V6E0_9ASCO|nr:hypothetical protein TRICI_002520 [Trichomonascus ciferrii]
MVHRVSLRTSNKEKLIDLTTRLVLEKTVNHREFTTAENGIHVSVFEFEERAVVFDLVKELDNDISWNYELVQPGSENHNNNKNNENDGNSNNEKTTSNDTDESKNNNGTATKEQTTPPGTAELKQAKAPSLEKNGKYQFLVRPTFKTLPKSPQTMSSNPTPTPRITDSNIRSASPPRDQDRTQKSPNATPKTIDSKVRTSSPVIYSTELSRKGSKSVTTTPRTIDTTIRPPSSPPGRHLSPNLSNRIGTSSPPRQSKDLSSRISRRNPVPDETQRSIMEEHISSRTNGHGKRKSVHLSEQDCDRIKIPRGEAKQLAMTSEAQPIPVERKETTNIPVSRIQSNQNIVIQHQEQEPRNIALDWMFYYKILLIRNEPHSQTSGPIHLHIHGYTFRVIFELVSLKCKVTVYYEGCSNVVVSVMKTAITAISALPGQESQCVPSKDSEKYVTISPETPRHEQIGSFEFPMVWKLREKRLFYILMKIS